jgi:hypothetical protein
MTPGGEVIQSLEKSMKADRIRFHGLYGAGGAAKLLGPIEKSKR